MEKALTEQRRAKENLPANAVMYFGVQGRSIRSHGVTPFGGVTPVWRTTAPSLQSPSISAPPPPWPLTDSSLDIGPQQHGLHCSSVPRRFQGGDTNRRTAEASLPHLPSRIHSLKRWRGASMYLRELHSLSCCIKYS